MKLRWVLAVGVVVAGCAAASPIGTLGIASSGVVDATLTSIFFTPDPSALPSGSGTCPGPDCWNGDVNTGTNLTFAGGPLVTREGILINGGFAFGAPPPPDATTFNPFFQFALHPNLLFFVTAVSPGSATTDCASATATGQSCSISVDGTASPVVLTVVGDSTLVSINFRGTATDGTGPLSIWSGAFSATIPIITPRDIELLFCPSGACTSADVERGTVLPVESVSGSFHASLSPVPEPGTLALVLCGAGFVMIGLLRRRRTGSDRT